MEKPFLTPNNAALRLLQTIEAIEFENANEFMFEDELSSPNSSQLVEHISGEQKPQSIKNKGYPISHSQLQQELRNIKTFIDILDSEYKYLLNKYQ